MVAGAGGDAVVMAAAGAERAFFSIFTAQSNSESQSGSCGARGHVGQTNAFWRYIQRYLQSARKYLVPFWVTILARLPCHECETALKVTHVRLVNDILGQSVVDIHHAKNRACMQCVLEVDIQDMSI